MRILDMGSEIVLDSVKDISERCRIYRTDTKNIEINNELKLYGAV
jgi:hypothetical protein